MKKKIKRSIQKVINDFDFAWIPITKLDELYKSVLFFFFLVKIGNIHMEHRKEIAF